MSMEENKKLTPEELIAQLEETVGAIKDEAGKGNPPNGYLLIADFGKYTKTNLYGPTSDLAYMLANVIHSNQIIRDILLKALSIISAHKELDGTSGKEEQQDEEDREDLN